MYIKWKHCIFRCVQWFRNVELTPLMQAFITWNTLRNFITWVLQMANNTAIKAPYVLCFSYDMICKISLAIIRLWCTLFELYKNCDKGRQATKDSVWMIYPQFWPYLITYKLFKHQRKSLWKFKIFALCISSIIYKALRGVKMIYNVLISSK
jgi:hypothetical protein